MSKIKRAVAQGCRPAAPSVEHLSGAEIERILVEAFAEPADELTDEERAALLAGEPVLDADAIWLDVLLEEEGIDTREDAGE